MFFFIGSCRKGVETHCSQNIGPDVPLEENFTWLPSGGMCTSNSESSLPLHFNLLVNRQHCWWGMAGSGWVSLAWTEMCFHPLGCVMECTLQRLAELLLAQRNTVANSSNTTRAGVTVPRNLVNNNKTAFRAQHHHKTLNAGSGAMTTPCIGFRLVRGFWIESIKELGGWTSVLLEWPLRLPVCAINANRTQLDSA